MELELNTVLEDESPQEIAELLLEMWRQCCAGNSTLVTDTLAKEFTRHEVIQKSQKIDIEDADSDNDCLSTVMESIMETDDANMVTADIPKVLTVDADGWEIVTKSRRKR